MSTTQPDAQGGADVRPDVPQETVVFRPVAAAGGFVYQLSDGRRVARDVMERLTAAGMLRRVFAERINTCPQCGSASVLFREVCPHCQGAGIEQPEAIHHFPCAGVFRAELFGGPEERICPKCRKPLQHVGVDHEYLQADFVCESCNRVSSVVPTYGRCLDCDAQFPAEQSGTDNWYDYVPTERWDPAMLGPPDPAPGGPPQPRVLIVDDIEDNLDLLEDLLEDRALQLVRAASGAAALQALERDTFDLIILDVSMPDMDGFATARRIRAMQHCRTTPILFLTAFHTGDNDLLTGLQAGANDYVNKPVDADDLVARIEEMLRRGNAARR